MSRTLLYPAMGFYSGQYWRNPSNGWKRRPAFMEACPSAAPVRNEAQSEAHPVVRLDPLLKRPEQPAKARLPAHAGGRTDAGIHPLAWRC